MSRNVTRIAVLVLSALVAAIIAGACGTESPTSAATTTAADYAGLWVNPESDTELWLHVASSGNTVTLRWEREWDQPVVQQATVQGDGTLKAVAAAADLESGSDGERAYTGRLTSDGGLDLSTTTHVTGVDVAIPVTLHFERGSKAKYDKFADHMNRNLKEQRVSEAFSKALDTIGVGIRAWQDTHGLHKAPPVDAVRPGGAVGKALRADGKTWPRLSDGRLLLPGTGRGEYAYRRLPHGYRIGGLEPNGQGVQTHSATW